MSISTVHETVTVWTDTAGIPRRIMWRGERFLVSDEPTRLDDMVAGIMHPPQVSEWRFQGTDDSGQSQVFDVRAIDDGQEWKLIRVYE